MTTSSEQTKVAQVERAISILLRVGVLASLTVVVVGVVVTFAQLRGHSSSAIRHAVVTGHISYPHTLGQLESGLAAGRGPSIITLGLLILLLTPVCRVALSLVGFLYQRDPVFVAVTSFVLFVLLMSFLIGRATA